MDEREVRRLLNEGKKPWQVVRILGGSRAEVHRIAIRKQRNAHKRVFIGCVIALVLGILLFAWYQSREFDDPHDIEVNSRIAQSAGALPRTALSNSWFMEHIPSGQDAQMALLERMVTRLNKALTDNSDVPEVREVAVLFGGNLVPTIFMRGITMWVGKDASSFTMGSQKLEVTLYGREDFTHPRISRRLFFYDPEWRSVFMAALNLKDEAWFGAINGHELWHAKLHREGAASSIAPVLSDLWIQEELEAHHIGSKILDARTKGMYHNRLHAIVKRRQARTIKKFIAAVEPSDIRELDSSFVNALPQEADTRTAQYYLDLSLLWLKNHYTGTALQEKRKELYRFLISPTSTNVQ